MNYLNEWEKVEAEAEAKQIPDEVYTREKYKIAKDEPGYVSYPWNGWSEEWSVSQPVRGHSGSITWMGWLMEACRRVGEVMEREHSWHTRVDS